MTLYREKLVTLMQNLFQFSSGGFLIVLVWRWLGGQMILVLHSICKTESDDDETRTIKQTTKLHAHAAITSY